MEVLVKDIIAQAIRQLDDAGIIESYTDSWLLAEDILHVTKHDLLLRPELSVNEDLSEKYFEAVRMRTKHIPLQYITGHQQFMDYDFLVNKDVLIPRPETELLVEKIVSYIGNLPVKVLDMCTGSGCIAISVDKMCENAMVDAADISDKALKVAKKNNIRNKSHVTFIKSNLFDNIKEKYDIIISNPPYISTPRIGRK